MFGFEKEKELIWKSIYEIRDAVNKQADVIRKIREEKGQLPEIHNLYRKNNTGTVYIVKGIAVDVSEGSITNTEMVVFERVLFERFGFENDIQYIMGVDEFNKKFKKWLDDKIND
jgi:hypothetical protein